MSVKRYKRRAVCDTFVSLKTDRVTRVGQAHKLANQIINVTNAATKAGVSTQALSASLQKDYLNIHKNVVEAVFSGYNEILNERIQHALETLEHSSYHHPGIEFEISFYRRMRGYFEAAHEHFMEGTTDVNNTSTTKL